MGCSTCAGSVALGGSGSIEVGTAAGGDGAAGGVAVVIGGLATVLGGRGGTAEAGVTLVRGGAAATVGRGGAAGWAVFCVIAFNTSPGFEMCDRSIFGLNSSLAVCAPLPGAEPGSPCSA